MKQYPLGNINVKEFLSKYWQIQPLLIRNALPNLSSPVTADELAGLACEEQVESRLIINEGDNWQLAHGPFTENSFSQLPSSHWTLLVQAVDHYIPAAADLLQCFNFIPRWRIDDLMVSYAPQGGGVGPHFDHYDVFLVQTQGQRTWEIGGHYTNDSELIADLPVKIVKHFQAQHSWRLNPGDILYLPPGVGHNGISNSDDCMTCSVGFNAPSYRELLHEYTDYIAKQLDDSQRYQDPNLTLSANNGEISSATLEKIARILSEQINQPDLIHEWFGRYMTTPKYSQLNDLKVQQSEHNYVLSDLQNYFIADKCLLRNESSRFAYQTQAQQKVLFVDGQRIDTTAEHNELIALVCNQRRITSTDFSRSDQNLALLLKLVNLGALYLME